MDLIIFFLFLMTLFETINSFANSLYVDDIIYCPNLEFVIVYSNCCKY